MLDSNRRFSGDRGRLVPRGIPPPPTLPQPLWMRTARAASRYPEKPRDHRLAIEIGLSPRRPRRDSQVNGYWREGFRAQLGPALPSRYTATAVRVLGYRVRPTIRWADKSEPHALIVSDRIGPPNPAAGVGDDGASLCEAPGRRIRVWSVESTQTHRSSAAVRTRSSGYIPGA